MLFILAETGISRNIILYLQDIATPFLDVLFKAITMLGEQEVFIAVICFVFWNISRKRGMALGVTVLFSAFFNLILKFIFKVPRPFQVLESVDGKRLSTASGYAFPSGHTQNSATFYYSLVYLIRKRWYTVIALIIPALVALSRLYLGVHWPIDVAAGYLLGIFSAALVYTVVIRLSENKSLWQMVSVVIGAVFFIVSIVLAAIYGSLNDQSETILDILKATSLLSGLFLTVPITNGPANFSTAGTWKRKILRFLIGIITAFILLTISKLVIPDTPIFDFLRYFLTAFWAFGLYPLIGIKTGLFSVLPE